MLNCIANTPTWYTYDIKLNVACPGYNGTSGTRCVLANDSDGKYSFEAPDVQAGAQEGTRMLYAEPAGALSIKGNKAVRIEGNNWTIEGVRFDGNRTEGVTSLLIHVRASNVTLRGNWIGNSGGTCVALGDTNGINPSTGLFDSNFAPIQLNNVKLLHNRIDGCYRSPIVAKDHHCIYNSVTNDVTIAFNDIRNCSGDGYQTENNAYAEASPHWKQVAANTKIIGNTFAAGDCRMYTFETPHPTDPEGPPTLSDKALRLGENAIDIKRSGTGLLIKDNLIYGYQMPGDYWCAGTSDSTGFRGVAIVVHGAIEQPIAVTETNKAELNPLCTIAQRDAGDCAVIEGNDISGSGGGITIGSNPALGRAPQGIVVRGNFIHDLRWEAEAAPLTRPRNLGSAFQLRQFEGNADVKNLVYRNTIANITGEAFTVNYRSSDCDTRFTPGSDNWTDCKTDSASFELHNNLIAFTGGRNAASRPGETCSGLARTQPNQTPAGYTADTQRFFQALDPDNNAETSPSNNPQFKKPYSPATGPASVDVTQATCGAYLEALPLEFWTEANIGNMPYNYRLTWNGSAGVGSAVDTGLPGFARLSNTWSGVCGTAPDQGASEACNPSLVYMRDHPTDPGRDEEYYPGPDSWTSPDISVIAATLGYTNPDLDADLKYETPYFNQDMEVLVRVRATQAIPNGTSVRVRLFQGDPHASLEFPADFREIAEHNVSWGETSDNGYTCTPSSSEACWRRVKGSSTINVFAFKWRPHGIISKSRHACLRAEISTERDPAPPLYTHYAHSNNVAQRNLVVEWSAQDVSVIPVTISPDYAAGRLGAQTTVRRLVAEFSSRHLRRKAYFFRPTASNPPYVNDGTQSFPPAGARALTLNGVTEWDESIPTSAATEAQLLVDNRTALRPHPSDYVALKDGRNGLRTNLAGNSSAATGESAEFGLPSGWIATGAWRVVDQYAPGEACGSAVQGRRAFAYNSAQSCTYEGTSASGGSLTMAATVLPCFGNPSLTFWQWTKTDQRPGFDVRKVEISVAGGAWQQIYSASALDMGSAQQWHFERVNLNAYRGKQVRLRFSFIPGDNNNNAFAGWYVDDIQVK